MGQEKFFLTGFLTAIVGLVLFNLSVFIQDGYVSHLTQGIGACLVGLTFALKAIENRLPVFDLDALLPDHFLRLVDAKTRSTFQRISHILVILIQMALMKSCASETHTFSYAQQHTALKPSPSLPLAFRS